MTIGQIFLQQARSFASRRFIFKPDQSSVTYRCATLKIADWVLHLQKLGIKKGDRVICYNEMPDPMIYFFLAAQFLGAVPVPVSPLFSVSYVNELAERMKSRFIFCEKSVYSGAPLERISFPNDSGQKNIFYDFSAACEFLESVHLNINSNDILMLQSTAGSTGTPKLVIRKHSALTHYARHLNPELRNQNLQTPHRYLMLLSFAHSFAYHQLTTALSLGAELAIPFGIDTAVELSDIHFLAPTVLSLPPRVLRSFVIQENRIANKKIGSGLFPAGCQYVVIGGGQGDPSLLQRLKSEGITPIQIYSTSETSMIAITKANTWQENSTGHVLPSVEIKLDSDGEILVKTPGLMSGYDNDPLANSEAFCEDRFFKTGDIGAFAEGGNLKILGRKKDVFNTPEGSNIFPGRIEDMIETAAPGSHVLLVGDNKPYLSALIYLPPLSSWKSNQENGFLDPKNYLSVYHEMGELLLAVNSQLERPEMIVRFHVFLKDFPLSCYQRIQGAKIRRDRSETAKIFSSAISDLYASTVFYECTFVPGIDRRL